MFSGEISKAPYDCVLCYCDTIALKTPKSRENNEGRRYFDYCGITTTEYKWTTKVLRTAVKFITRASQKSKQLYNWVIGTLTSNMVVNFVHEI